MYRQGVILKNDKFQTIGFHSSSSLNLFTSSNNRYVLLWRGSRVCAEAKTNRVSLVSSDLNTIEQLLDELWRRIRDRSVQSQILGQSRVSLHYDVCVASHAIGLTSLWGSYAAGEGHVFSWTNLTQVNWFRRERDIHSQVKNLSFLKMTPCHRTGE